MSELGKEPYDVSARKDWAAARDISTGAEYASQDEMDEYFRSVTVDPSERVKPIENHMENGLREGYVQVSQAIRLFQNVIAVETNLLLGEFQRWLDLTEQIHRATLDE